MSVKQEKKRIVMDVTIKDLIQLLPYTIPMLFIVGWLLTRPIEIRHDTKGANHNRPVP